MFTPDCMVDLETTSAQPEHGAIIQIAAVKFNLQTREVSPDFFDACLMMPPTRFWSESTREWWLGQNRETLEGIWRRMRDPRVVMQEFHAWCGGEKVLWAKPISFESPFLSSYFHEFELPNPFPYYKGRDLRSFIHGRAPGFDEKSVEFVGNVHNALDDTLHQLRILYAALDSTNEIEGVLTVG